MKITGIETIRLGEFGNLLWLQIHTDQGLVGLGETFFGPRAVEAYIHETVAPLLLGKLALASKEPMRKTPWRQISRAPLRNGPRSGTSCWRPSKWSRPKIPPKAMHRVE